jgi:hypothetical protein
MGSGEGKVRGGQSGVEGGCSQRGGDEGRGDHGISPPQSAVHLSVDGNQIAPHDGVWTPFKGTTEQPNFSYLHEREHKRELRLESAKEGTEITQSQHVDLERNLVFGLRSAFVQTLQAKAVLELAKADLEYYDKIIDISRARFKPATLPRSTWLGSSFSACNTSLKSRPQSSICARRRFSFCCCSTTARRSTSST